MDNIVLDIDQRRVFDSKSFTLAIWNKQLKKAQLIAKAEIDDSFRVSQLLDYALKRLK